MIETGCLKYKKVDGAPEVNGYYEVHWEYGEENRVDIAFWYGADQEWLGAMGGRVSMDWYAYRKIKAVDPARNIKEDGLKGAGVADVISSAFPQTAVIKFREGGRENDRKILADFRPTQCKCPECDIELRKPTDDEPLAVVHGVAGVKEYLEENGYHCIEKSFDKYQARLRGWLAGNINIAGEQP